MASSHTRYGYVGVYPLKIVLLVEVVDIAVLVVDQVIIFSLIEYRLYRHDLLLSITCTYPHAVLHCVALDN